MNHTDIQEALPELMAGTLDEQIEQEVLAHLVVCAACRVELAFWARVAKQLNDETAELPRDVYLDVRAVLFESETETMGFYESMETLGGALSVTRKACRLALSLGGRL